ncbi:hypothetical protein R6Q59_025763 [Mikania micrantha]|uniref:non-specific serine/threonine protein kinase n=1 Tax=Mikania micrantha TaxID=192012 RepID=A0A5N6PF69_9ASTR|nr:hypothetical protein E3N88_11027 [Mikania micrantha]
MGICFSNITNENLSNPPVPEREDQVLQSSDLKSFSYSELRMATKNFHADSMLGEGGFGSVFKGWIDEQSLKATQPGTGVAVAVKRLDPGSFQGQREWLAEVNYLGKISHPNIVRLIGYCMEGENRLLVYEFMPRGSLDNHLFRRGSYFRPLSWTLRLKVVVGAAKALAFLHSADVKVIYRDFKTSNVLLSSDHNAKLSDFGIARDGPIGDNSHVTTRVMGSYGYAAPEYLATSHLTPRCDVFSFGVVLLEVLSGERAIDKTRCAPTEQFVSEWAQLLKFDNRKLVGRLLDNSLKGQYTLDGAYVVAKLALRCVSGDPMSRPSMAEVVQQLESVQEHASSPTR